MTERPNSVLLIGESGVGKTHYGAQLLKRLMQGGGQLRMKGAAVNLESFETALDRLSCGMAAGHTPTPVYVESIWPIEYDGSKKGELIWPDYGGEQIKEIVRARSIERPWMARIMEGQSWLLLLRLTKIRTTDDVFSKPLAQLKQRREENAVVPISDQSRLIELLQMFMNIRGIRKELPITAPGITVLLTCWDELQSDGIPSAVLRAQLPMFADFIDSNWQSAHILGISALERPLSKEHRDQEFENRGPENFGYVILQNGDRTPDLTLPIKLALSSTT